MYNKAFLIGNLTRDPEIRYTTSGVPVARFAIAINRNIKSTAEGKTSDVDFINIVAWRRLAEICGEYLKKGMPIAIEGRLQIRSYTKNGEEKSISEVVADNMQMLSRKRDVVQGENSSNSTIADNSADLNSEEVPF